MPIGSLITRGLLFGRNGFLTGGLDIGIATSPAPAARLVTLITRGLTFNIWMMITRGFTIGPKKP